jgi:LacI family transcriptional regulator, repressor for deo operon, udp, cdd, tsx, nupC, and nupG
MTKSQSRRSNESGVPPERGTIADVAREAGVSTATVSRALRQFPNVSGSTRDRVVRAAHRLNYLPNPNAARLASGDTRTIGLLAPVLTSWYTSEVVAGVEEVLTEAGRDLLIGTANPLASSQHFRGLGFHQRTDGVILVDALCEEEGAAELVRSGVRAVAVGEHLSAITSIKVDNRHGGFLAGDHLVGLGHTSIGLIVGILEARPESPQTSERVYGFTEALRASGHVPMVTVPTDLSMQGGFGAMNHLLDLPAPPSAVFATTDELAFGACLALRQRASAPAVSIVGFDDHPVAVAMGLTTVHQPVREMGRLAARELLADEPAEPVQHEMELSLVVRSSTSSV